MSRQTSHTFESSRDNIDTWGDTRSPEGISRRACVFTFPPDTNIPEFQKFFGLNVVEGISLVKKARKPTAFIQFKRPIDYTNALLRNQENFLGSGYRITIRPYYEEDKKANKKEKRRAPIPSNSPSRIIRSRSRSQDRGRENRRHPSPEIARRHPRVESEDCSYTRGHRVSLDRGRFPGRDERVEFVYSKSPVKQSQNTDEWRRALGLGREPFNRNDDPDLRGEIVFRRSDNHSVVTQLPPNSHSFGCLPPTRVPSNSSTFALVPTSQLTYTHTHYIGQPAQPLDKLALDALAILPRSIQLILNLIVEKNTAKDLSAEQIREILDFFTAALVRKEAVEPDGQGANSQSSPETRLDNGNSAASSQQQPNSHDPSSKTGDEDEFNQVIKKILDISKQERM